jgi:uncharacterized protein
MKGHQFGFRGENFFFDPGSLSLRKGGPGDPFPRDQPAPGAGPAPDGSRPGRVVEILVNATEECNLACPYCFVRQGEFSYPGKHAKRLSPDLARRLIQALPDAIPGAREYNIHFYGGEPLLNLEAIGTAVREARQSPVGARFTFSITTNGTVNTREALPLLSAGHFSVILSIDGPAPVHDAARRDIRGGPTHARVLSFLSRLREEPSLFIRGSSVVRHGWSLKEAGAYLNTLPVDAIKAQAVRLPPGHPLGLTPGEQALYHADLADLAGEILESIGRGELPRDDRFTSRVLQLISRTPRSSFCGAGRTIFGMACDGTMYPCVLLAGKEDLVLGDIRDPDNGWVRKGEEWLIARERRAECTDCWAFPLCGGGCPAMLGVCGEDECENTRRICELALGIYGSVENKADLLVLAGIP